MEVIEDKGKVFEPSKNFTDLIVWQKAHEFVLETYKVTRDFPMEERFALCTQFQRAAVSIPANIAEGYKKFISDAKTERECVTEAVAICEAKGYVNLDT